MSKKKTHEEFINEVNKQNNKVIILSKYDGRTKPIRCKCKICGNEWITQASNLLRGTGCPICGRKKCENARRKTHKTFLKQLYDINSDIVVLGKYVNDKTKIEIQCKKCGYKWKASPSNLLQGKGCKMCHYKQTKQDRMLSNEEFLSRVTKLAPNIEVLEKYNGMSNKIKCRCRIHNNEGYITPSHLLSGETFCKDCISYKLKNINLKSNNIFIKELQNANSNIIPLELYSGAKNKIKVKCKKCGAIWETSPDYLISGRAHCVVCSPVYSKGEFEISKYLTEQKVEYILHKSFNGLVGVGGNKLTYDFFIPKSNILIEYQGQYHDGTAKNQSRKSYLRQVEHDRRKRKFALANNINFYEIWYYDNTILKLKEILLSNPCRDYSDTSNRIAYAN